MKLASRGHTCLSTKWYIHYRCPHCLLRLYRPESPAINSSGNHHTLGVSDPSCGGRTKHRTSTNGSSDGFLLTYNSNTVPSSGATVNASYTRFCGFTARLRASYHWQRFFNDLKTFAKTMVFVYTSEALKSIDACSCDSEQFFTSRIFEEQSKARTEPQNISSFVKDTMHDAIRTEVIHKNNKWLAISRRDEADLWARRFFREISKVEFI